MIDDPNNEETSAGNSDSPENNANTAEKFRNPRATRKGPDMPGDHERHRTDPEEDYEKPDGSERDGLPGSGATGRSQR